MRQLHPRAVWLFFFSKIIAWIFIAGFLAIQGAVVLSDVGKSPGDFFSVSLFGWFILIFATLIVIGLTRLPFKT